MPNGIACRHGEGLGPCDVLVVRRPCGRCWPAAALLLSAGCSSGGGDPRTRRPGGSATGPDGELRRRLRAPSGAPAAAARRPRAR